MTMNVWYEPKYFVIGEFVCKCGCGLGSGKDDALPAAIVMALDMIRGRIGIIPYEARRFIHLELK